MHALIRRARAEDIVAIRELVAPAVKSGAIIDKPAVAYYESLQEFIVAVHDGHIVGCGALHVMWKDLAEVRTLAVDEKYKGHGIGGRILDSLLHDARMIGVNRLFCLTFETAFFGRYGFEPIDGQTVDSEVYAQLLRSYDEGVAEFLDLERVKPNTLGNTRMLLRL